MYTYKNTITKHSLRLKVTYNFKVDLFHLTSEHCKMIVKKRHNHQASFTTLYKKKVSLSVSRVISDRCAIPSTDCLRTRKEFKKKTIFAYTQRNGS